MAPEVYRREAYGKSVDVFSFAIIVQEVLKISVFWQFIFYLPAYSVWGGYSELE